MENSKNEGSIISINNETSVIEPIKITSNAKANTKKQFQTKLLGVLQVCDFY